LNLLLLTVLLLIVYELVYGICNVIPFPHLT